MIRSYSTSWRRFTLTQLVNNSRPICRRLHSHRSSLTVSHGGYTENSRGMNCFHRRRNGHASANRGPCRLRYRLSDGLLRRVAMTTPTISQRHPSTHRSSLAPRTTMFNAISVGNTGIGKTCELSARLVAQRSPTSGTWKRVALAMRYSEKSEDDLIRR